MAKRNYNYEKRQRELAKQKKQEKKRQRKLEKDGVPPEENPDQPSKEEEPG